MGKASRRYEAESQRVVNRFLLGERVIGMYDSNSINWNDL